MMLRVPVVITVLELLLASCCFAQSGLGMPDPETTGTHYLLAFPDTTATAIDTVHQLQIRDTFVVLIYCGVQSRAVFSGDGGYYREVPLEAGHFTTVYLNDSANRPRRIVCDVVDRPVPDAVDLRTDDPVVVYCLMYTRFGGEGWTPIPVDRWGQEYYAIAPPGAVVEDVVDTTSNGGTPFYARRLKGAPAEMLIIAAYDETSIDVEGPGSIGHRSISLNSGECYQIQASAEAESRWQDLEDLSGSHITASRPVGVLCAATRSWMRDDTLVAIGTNIHDHTLNAFRGMTASWLAPTECYGTDFFCAGLDDVTERLDSGGPPLYSKNWTSRSTVRMIGNNHGSIEITGIGDSAGHRITINPGHPVDCQLENGARYQLTSSDPIEVYCLRSSAEFKQDWAAADFTSRTVGKSGSAAEVIPRNSWCSFAPIVAFYSPWGFRNYVKHFDIFADSVRHFLRIVTDSLSQHNIYWNDGSPCNFDSGAVAGTNLVWTDVAITDGAERALIGRNGSTFAASYRAAAVGESLERPPVDLPVWLYQEVVGISMAFPLAPRRTSASGAANPRQPNCDRSVAVILTPNPVRARAIIQCSGCHPYENVHLSISTVLGQEVFHCDDRTDGNGGLLQSVDVSRLAPSFYVVHSTTARSSTSTTLVRIAP